MAQLIFEHEEFDEESAEAIAKALATLNNLEFFDRLIETQKNQFLRNFGVEEDETLLREIRERRLIIDTLTRLQTIKVEGN